MPWLCVVDLSFIVRNRSVCLPCLLIVTCREDAASGSSGIRKLLRVSGFPLKREEPRKAGAISRITTNLTSVPIPDVRTRYAFLPSSGSPEEPTLP